MPTRHTLKAPDVPSCPPGDDRLTRKWLFEADAAHDFGDMGRVKKIVKRESLIAGLTEPVSETLSSKCAAMIQSKLSELFIPLTCQPDMYHENSILHMLYPDHTSTTEFPPKTNVDNFISLRVNYGDLTALVKYVDALPAATNPKRTYVSDISLLSEDLLCKALLDKRKEPIIKTIATELDRSSYAAESPPCVKRYAPPLETQLLSQHDGTLHPNTFDRIDYVDESRLRWVWKDKFGIINVRDMIRTKSERLENLSMMVIGFCNALYASNPSGFEADLTSIFEECVKQLEELYGVPRQLLANPKLYATFLVTFKALGDTLQLKLATHTSSVFLSNDRIACMMAARGFKLPTIRTSKSSSPSKEQADRIITLYNFRKYDNPALTESISAHIVKTYANTLLLYDAIWEATSTYLHFYTSTIDGIRNLHIWMCVDLIAHFTGQCANITSVTVPKEHRIYARPHRACKAETKIYNLEYATMRSLVKLLEYIKMVFQIIDQVLLREGAHITVKNEVYTEHLNYGAQLSWSTLVNIYRSKFEAYLPHPDSVFVNTPADNIVTYASSNVASLRMIVQTLHQWTFGFNASTNGMGFFRLPKEDMTFADIMKFIDGQTLSFQELQLFGEPLQKYCKYLLRLSKVKRSTEPIVIGGRTYTAGLGDAHIVIEELEGIEEHMQGFIERYSKFTSDRTHFSGGMRSMMNNSFRTPHATATTDRKSVV